MEKKVRSNKERTREMTILAMFIAIIAVLGLVPNGMGGAIGFIKITSNMEATIIHIPVLIGAALLGRKIGIYLGLAFGVVSLIAAFIYSSPLFYYPWVSVLPRIIFGLLIYDVVKFFMRVIKSRYLALAVSFFLLTVIHTLLVLPMLWTSFAMVFGFDSLGEAFIPYLTALNASGVPITAPVEAVLAAVVGATIVIRLIPLYGKDQQPDNNIEV
ncbi:MAG: ECF transporter S component [Candidatus Izemoplasmatales bacterium]|nr:ECF transporter S component [Candidatus Izemoplasmatales bacterium]